MTVVRPSLVFEAEQKAQENKWEVAEMRMQATMDVRSYEAGQYKKLKNKGDNQSGEIAKEIQRNEVEVVWASDEKRRAL